MYQNDLEKEIRLITSEAGQNIPPGFFCFLKAEGEEEAAEKTLELLGEDKWLPPTCILFSDDTVMQGGIKAILQRKLRIPEDISVAALSFRGCGTISGRRVTSWSMPPDRIAKEAVDMIIHEIRVPGGCSRQTQFVKGDMIEGETACILQQC
jgi:LacI family transcriptional regulator/LacI family purine nucleotide synthesis repressor